MKTGQQIQLAFNPDIKGAVARVDADGTVHVTWRRVQVEVSKGHATKGPRMRVAYDRETANRILVAAQR